MSANCVFCAIAAKKLPAHIVCESDDLIAFLDIHPVQSGHMLIIPKAHYATFEDLPRETAANIIVMAQDLSRRLKARFAAPRTGFAFAGFDVPHAHAHVMPMFSIADLTSQKCFAEENLTFRPPPRADDGALAALAQELHRDLSQDAEGQLHRGLPQDAADKLHRGLPQDAEEKSRKL